MENWQAWFFYHMNLCSTLFKKGFLIKNTYQDNCDKFSANFLSESSKTFWWSLRENDWLLFEGIMNSSIWMRHESLLVKLVQIEKGRINQKIQKSYLYKKSFTKQNQLKKWFEKQNQIFRLSACRCFI